MANETVLSPKHVGYIVDGNRRWAKKHGLPAYEGHLAGYNALKDIVINTFDNGAEYVSAYVFSTENWKRSTGEVRKLMGLVIKALNADLPIFHTNEIRVKIIGSTDGVHEKILKAIEKAETDTAHYEGKTFLVCFNYGGQLEITDAVKKIVQSGVAADEIDEELIANNLYAPEAPALDLVVRTGGDQRLSNFMLWRAAYSEFIFLDKAWPDMTNDDVTAIMEEYKKRQRRFGS